MPLIYALISLLVSLVPVFIAKILIALGVGVVSYTGVSLLLGRLAGVVTNSLGSIPADLGVFLNLAGVDVCFTMVLSALSIRLALKTTNGVLSKISFTNKAVTP